MKECAKSQPDLKHLRSDSALRLSKKISMGRTLAAVPTQGEDDEDDEEPPAETDSSTESKPPTGPAPHNRGAADYSTIPLGH